MIPEGVCGTALSWLGAGPLESAYGRLSSSVHRAGSRCGETVWRAWLLCGICQDCYNREVVSRLRGAVAQLGERLVRNEEASGSIPLSSTKSSTHQNSY